MQVAYAITNSRGEIAESSGRLMIFVHRFRAEEVARDAGPSNKVIEIVVVDEAIEVD